MDQTLTGFSRALYSNWIWHRPLHLLVDAGEGVALALGTNVFKPSLVALTHGHSDHVLGLPGLAGARRFGKGAPDKPWTVLYPDGSPGVAAIREGIAALWRGVEFPVSWIAMAPGDAQPMPGRRTLEAFAVQHVSEEPTLGYRVLEPRHRLRAEYAGRPAAEIEALVRRDGRARVMEEGPHVLFAHSGDAMPIDPALVQDADLLVHDATFLGSRERRWPIHATSEEVFALARAARVRTLVINHLSIRYDRTLARQTLAAQLAASGFEGHCFWLDENALVNLR